MTRWEALVLVLVVAIAPFARASATTMSCVMARRVVDIARPAIAAASAPRSASSAGRSAKESVRTANPESSSSPGSAPACTDATTLTRPIDAGSGAAA
ncbi:MAG: hypothetical protein ACKOEP_10840, partial [Phycisphaerales bacterium]